MENSSSQSHFDTLDPHILIVEDDSELVESIRYTLKQAGYRVSVAYDGNQGLAIAESKLPDLILLDLMLPKRSGFLVLERLCQTLKNPIPIIVITASEGRRHQEYAQMLGASDYIRKPFVTEQLLTSIATHLNQARTLYT